MSIPRSLHSPPTRRLKDLVRGALALLWVVGPSQDALDDPRLAGAALPALVGVCLGDPPKTNK